MHSLCQSSRTSAHSPSSVPAAVPACLSAPARDVTNVTKCYTFATRHSHAHTPARVLSQGQRRRVALARMSLTRRRLWVLDEPATGLDAAGIATLERRVDAHLAGRGVAVIATHQPLALSRAPRKVELRSAGR